MKIGIVLLPEYFACHTLHEFKTFYTAKYNLDDLTFVAFKGTDQYMRCRDYQYEFGRNEDRINDKPLALCENGLHFCLELNNVFNYYYVYDLFCYGFDSIKYEHTCNRFFIALPERPVLYTNDKSCSKVLNILKEIPRDMVINYFIRMRQDKHLTKPIFSSGLYYLVNDAVNDFIANNKDCNDYINLMSNNERNDI